jgi:chemotaxis protein methyltransferase CheR
LTASTLSDREFEQIRHLLYEQAGISLSPGKKALVIGRLAKRLQAHGLDSFGDYFSLLTDRRHGDELTTAIDLLTTNETYFFREPKHFEFLRQEILPKVRPGRTFRVWSAASSSGEEAYSIAMTLADALEGHPWEVVGSDLSTRVLERARAGVYPMPRAKDIPDPLLKRCCLKGVRSQEGSFAIDPDLRRRVSFLQVNLIEALPQLGEFDLVFLRNVMIYFDHSTKQQVVQRVVSTLRPGGTLFIGHSEALHPLNPALSVVRPSILRKRLS